MAENLDVPGRLAVRTPMQWTSGANGGFSRAPKLEDDLAAARRAVRAGTRQRLRPTSRSRLALVVHADLIYTYRQQPQIGWSEVEVLKQPNRPVLAHVCREDESGWAMVALHNFGAESCIVPIELPDLPEGSILVDLLDGLTTHELRAEGRIELELEGYGHRWLRVLRGRPPAHLNGPGRRARRGGV